VSSGAQADGRGRGLSSPRTTPPVDLCTPRSRSVDLSIPDPLTGDADSGDERGTGTPGPRLPVTPSSPAAASPMRVTKPRRRSAPISLPPRPAGSVPPAPAFYSPAARHRQAQVLSRVGSGPVSPGARSAGGLAWAGPCFALRPVLYPGRVFYRDRFRTGWPCGLIGGRLRAAATPRVIVRGPFSAGWGRQVRVRSCRLASPIRPRPSAWFRSAGPSHGLKRDLRPGVAGRLAWPVGRVRGRRSVRAIQA
jgi:hypothetical protein